MQAETKTEDFVTGEMLIGEAVAKYPEIAHVMQSYGLHCIGCHVASWETIEQGALGHGLGEKEIEKMVTEINEKISSKKKQ